MNIHGQVFVSMERWQNWLKDEHTVNVHWKLETGHCLKAYHPWALSEAVNLEVFFASPPPPRRCLHSRVKVSLSRGEDGGWVNVPAWAPALTVSGFFPVVQPHCVHSVTRGSSHRAPWGLGPRSCLQEALWVCIKQCSLIQGFLSEYTHTNTHPQVHTHTQLLLCTMTKTCTNLVVLVL